jgi:hypothetical protein
MMLLDGLESEEFDRLMERFIDREDPNAMSFEALGQAARLQLAEMEPDPKGTDQSAKPWEGYEPKKKG